MESAPHKKQKPLALVMLMCFVLLVVIAIGIFFIQNTAKQQYTKTEPTCRYDKNVCLFLSQINKPNQFYNSSITATISLSQNNATKGEVVVTADTKNNMYATLAQNGKEAGEVLLIGNALYKKDQKGVWQQQQNLGNEIVTQFRAKALRQVNKSGTDITYRFVTKTPCGAYTCWQYEIVTPTQGKTKEFIFFDTQYHLLRKTVTQTATGTTTETTFAYTPVTITPPPLP